jgi:hypothetical protein
VIGFVLGTPEVCLGVVEVEPLKPAPEFVEPLIAGEDTEEAVLTCAEFGYDCSISVVEAEEPVPEITEEAADKVSKGYCDPEAGEKHISASNNINYQELFTYNSKK